MNKLSCIIIEDEPLALERTKSYVLKTPFLELLGTFDNALEGLACLKSTKIDLLLLDINMDEFSGIDLLESAKLDCHVIITTAYSEYAIKGYELHVVDYLLKPFTFERFLKAINKIKPEREVISNELKANCIFIKTENRLEKVNLDEILFIEGMRDYRRIHTSHKKIMTLQNFAELEQIIPPNIICRVHKSYMVSINKIEEIERSQIKILDQFIPISDTYRNHFFAQINN